MSLPGDIPRTLSPRTAFRCDRRVELLTRSLHFLLSSGFWNAAVILHTAVVLLVICTRLLPCCHLLYTVIILHTIVASCTLLSSCILLSLVRSLSFAPPCHSYASFASKVGWLELKLLPQHIQRFFFLSAHVRDSYFIANRSGNVWSRTQWSSLTAPTLGSMFQVV